MIRKAVERRGMMTELVGCKGLGVLRLLIAKGVRVVKDLGSKALRMEAMQGNI